MYESEGGLGNLLLSVTLVSGHYLYSSMTVKQNRLEPGIYKFLSEYRLKENDPVIVWLSSRLCDVFLSVSIWVKLHSVSCIADWTTSFIFNQLLINFLTLCVIAVTAMATCLQPQAGVGWFLCLHFMSAQWTRHKMLNLPNKRCGFRLSVYACGVAVHLFKS